ncbi:hypothetical protein AB6B38_07605 [Glycocaulis abyssi]|uniref:Uncharacterized protein n=1 Tax=Glycocaulis abyssi TaxID=1433403 RepID=A0ABV9N9K1_9PROT
MSDQNNSALKYVMITAFVAIIVIILFWAIFNILSFLVEHGLTILIASTFIIVVVIALNAARTK